MPSCLCTHSRKHTLMVQTDRGGSEQKYLPALTLKKYVLWCSWHCFKLWEVCSEEQVAPTLMLLAFQLSMLWSGARERQTVCNKLMCVLSRSKKGKTKWLNQLRVMEGISLKSLDREDRTWGRQTDQMKSLCQGKYSQLLIQDTKRVYFVFSS